MTNRFVLFLAALAIFAVAFAPTASAHKTAYSPDGKIKIVWGFLNEPAVTDTKNGLDLRIMDNETGYAIPDLQSGLHAEMHYGDDEMEFTDLAGQHGKPGYYSGLITPSKAGIYVLHLSGMVNGTELDMEINSAHEVEDIADTYFPEKDAPVDLSVRLAALESEVAALKAQIKTQASTPATVTSQPTLTGSAPAPAVGVMLAALAVVGVALLLRRKA